MIILKICGIVTKVLAVYDTLCPPRRAINQIRPVKKKIIADLQLRNILGVAQDAPFRLRTSPWEESQRVILLGLTGSQGQPGLDGVDEEKWPA